MNPNDIEDILKTYADQLSVSEAKLRVVYSRGVKECLEEGYDGATYTYGLARVQRFVVASSTSNPRLTKDSDLFPQRNTDSSQTTYEISESISNSWGLVYDIMSSDGRVLAELFPQGSIEQTVYDTDTTELSVLGTHNEIQWSCTLNLSTGESTLTTNTK